MTGLPPVDKRQALASHFLFRDLRDEEFNAMLAHARLEQRKAQEVIFRQGMPGQGLIAVLSGRVKVTSSVAGKEIVLNIINAGEVFGEMALLDGGPRSADAVTVTPCELLVIDRRDFVPFLEANPSVCIRLLAVLSQRLRQTSEQVQDILFLDLRAQLAKTLLRLAEQQRAQAGPDRDIVVALSQRELSHLVGRSRESINKQLREWQDAGIVALALGKVTIRDFKALEGQCEVKGAD